MHDDVIKWKHFPRNWPFVRGIHRSPVNSPHKGQWRGALMFSLICVWINDWVNNGEAGDLRRYRIHYDVTVMTWEKMERLPSFWTTLYNCPTLGLCSLSGLLSYHKIAWSLEAARFGFRVFQLLWQVPPRQHCRDACRISEPYDHYNIQSRGFETSRGMVVRRLTALWIKSLFTVNSEDKSRLERGAMVTKLTVSSSYIYLLSHRFVPPFFFI